MTRQKNKYHQMSKRIKMIKYLWMDILQYHKYIYIYSNHHWSSFRRPPCLAIKPVLLIAGAWPVVTWSQCFTSPNYWGYKFQQIFGWRWCSKSPKRDIYQLLLFQKGVPKNIYLLVPSWNGQPSFCQILLRLLFLAGVRCPPGTSALLPPSQR